MGNVSPPVSSGTFHWRGDNCHILNSPRCYFSRYAAISGVGGGGQSSCSSSPGWQFQCISQVLHEHESRGYARRLLESVSAASVTDGSYLLLVRHFSSSPPSSFSLLVTPPHLQRHTPNARVTVHQRLPFQVISSIGRLDGPTYWQSGKHGLGRLITADSKCSAPTDMPVFEWLHSHVPLR